MALMTSWERKGLEQGLAKGLHEGREAIVLRQLRKGVGEVSAELTARIERLTSGELDDLGEALLDFTGRSDLEQWLSRHEAAARN